MRLDEILQLADKQGINFLPGDLLEAIWAIVSITDVNRRDPQAVAVHNAAVLAGQATIDNWMMNLPEEIVKKRADFLKDADLRGGLPTPPSLTASRVFPGAEGHTNPIEPTDKGTGLLRQKKPPRYDKYGHVT